MASLIGCGVGMYGSPPSKRHTLCPCASSSRTRLRTLTISEKPTESKRRAVRGKPPSDVMASSESHVSSPAPSEHLSPAGPEQEVQDHSEERQKDDEQEPENLGARVRSALQERDDRNDVEHGDENPPDRMEKHARLPM